MRRLATLSLVAMFAVSACSSEQSSPNSTTTVGTDATSAEPEVVAPAESDDESDDESVTETAAGEPAPVDVPATTDAAPRAQDPVDEDVLSLFIAAAERALEGTAQEAAIFDDPEIYIALAQTSCDRFSAGETFEQIATDLLADLDTARAADETRLVGAILGAATQTLCPEHADKI